MQMAGPLSQLLVLEWDILEVEPAKLSGKIENHTEYNSYDNTIHH